MYSRFILLGRFLLPSLNFVNELFDAFGVNNFRKYCPVQDLDVNVRVNDKSLQELQEQYKQLTTQLRPGYL